MKMFTLKEVWGKEKTYPAKNIQPLFLTLKYYSKCKFYIILCTLKSTDFIFLDRTKLELTTYMFKL